MTPNAHSGRVNIPLTVILTAIPFFMVSLDLLAVTNALPAIRHDFGATLEALQWTVNAYTLAFAASITTVAALGDRYGRRLLFVIGIGIFTLASVGCALAPNTQALIGARVIQGIGAGTIMPISLTILTGAVPPEKRGTIVGLWGAIGGLAVASGSLIGGALTEGLNWHWIFWVNVPIGVVATLLSWVQLHESKGAPTRLDLVAVVLVSGGATGVVWGLVRASQLGWSNVEAVSSLAAGLVFLIGFILWERQATNPMLPLRLFGSGTFSAAVTTGFFMVSTLTAGVFLTSQFFQLGLGYSPLDTGFHLLPFLATGLFIMPLGGALSDRVGRRPIILLGELLTALGFGLYGVIAGLETQYFPSILALTLAGIGLALTVPVLPTAALTAVAMQDMGKASGVNSTMQRFGSAFGVALATTVFGTYGSLLTPAAVASGFRPAVMTLAVLALVGALTSLGVRKPRLAAIPTIEAAAPNFAPPETALSHALGSDSLSLMDVPTKGRA
jgi:EmrB/QacA subfamily drug resistance transporter